MTPREIIAEAWAVTTQQKPVRRWGFLASFFETLFTLKLVIYQLWFGYSYLKGNPIGFFDDFLWLYAHVSPTAFFSILIGFVLLLCIEWIVPSLAKGAVIGLTAKAYQKEETKGGLVLALYNFFPMFGVHELFVMAAIANVVTICSLILRYISGDLKYTMIGIIIFIWLISNILKFLASFAEPAMVIRRVNIFDAIGQSFKLIVSYMEHVMFLWLLLFVISIRITINTALVLIIPGLAIGIGFLLTYVLSPLISYSIAGVIGIGLILVASYFFAYLHVFHDAVWTITYLELKKHKDLNVIEE